MTGDCHVRFCERRGVRIPPATRLNNDVHAHVARQRPDTKAELLEMTVAYLRTRTVEIVRRYFMAPLVRYAQ